MDNIPEKLKIARRALDSLKQVKILNHWNYDEPLKKWYLHISLDIKKGNQFIPKKSKWYIVVESEYPNGTIKVYPDVNDSICVTFFHQQNNALVESNGLWRKGSLCLVLNMVDDYNIEPHSVDERLLFHVERAISWLNASVDNSLVSKKDLFELPDFNYSFPVTKKFVFSEDEISFMQWEDTKYHYGVANLTKITKKNNQNICEIYYVKRFNSITSSIVHTTTWGELLSQEKDKNIIKALWIKLSKIPVLNVWQPPQTFEELKEVCLSQNIDIMEVLKKTAIHLRDGMHHFLLIGFPIPRLFFENDEVFYWQALYLPVFSYGNNTANGFRNNEKGYWTRDFQEILCDDLNLDWIKSENWNQDEITQRGKMSDILLRKRVLLLGAGCVGASLSEILVRSGVYNLTIMDMDVFDVGNLTRHTLSIEDVGNSKCNSLCNHLNTVNPHARVACINNQLQNNSKGETNIDLEQYDIIIDCTGNDLVLDTIEKIHFRKIHDIISVSVGMGAVHLYLHMYRGKQVVYEPFYRIISPYLQSDKKRFSDIIFPRDGTGCWHPTFPARSDDIWIAASTAVKVIESFIKDDKSTMMSMVFEQQETDNFFTGYMLVNKADG